MEFWKIGLKTHYSNIPLTHCSDRKDGRLYERSSGGISSENGGG